MTDSNLERETIKAKLLGETARCPFSTLQRFFAQGVLLQVADGTDLIEVGLAMATDDAEQMQRWMRSGSVGPLLDEVARSWLEDDTEVWTSIVKPWILVQAKR